MSRKLCAGYVFMFGIFAADHSHAATRLSLIFQQDMLNAQVPYLESITGPARTVNTAEEGVQSRNYNVDGCHVTAFARGNVIIGYALDLSRKCNFNLASFIGNGYPATDNLTVGKFGSGAFGIDMRVNSACVSSCGNSVDPTVDFTWEGPHAANYSLVVFTVTLAGERSLKAVDRWRDAMEKREGARYVEDTTFNCDRKYESLAISSFQNVLVSRITVGYEPTATSYKKLCQH